MSPATSTASPTVSLGHTRYAQLLNKIIHRLDNAGCEEIVPLPRIAVIGNQSSGKSSLIEAICQIKVPRANGTCTRCPMEVRLSTLNKPEWSGKIWLKKEVRTESGDTELQLQLFTAVTDPREVPLALKRAQLALLNPSKDSTDFLRYSDSECTEAAPRAERKFSSNIVVLEITGADVDVSFIDLPGIIQRVYDYSSMTNVVEQKRNR
jgi:GTPase SAR1 family protein